MKLTINQIAELAQVSKGTVSKVLNGHKGISAATRERVLKLVKQLDYHPDSSARALALQKTGVIGFLIPHEAEASLSGQYWSNILAGISHQAAHEGYSLMVLTTAREGDIEGALRQILKRSSVDGLIIGSELLDKKSLSTLVADQLPFVLLGQNPEFSHHSVDVDNRQGTSLMVDHMVAQGYRRIGALFGPREYPYVQERTRGYRETLARHGLVWTAEEHSDYRSPSIHAALNNLLDRAPDMDSLFLASGGDFMFDTFHVLKDRGLTMPEFGLGVFDDYSFLDILTPRITAIAQPLTLAGETAVDLLLRLIRETPEGNQIIQLPTTLVARESCGEGNRLP